MDNLRRTAGANVAESMGAGIDAVPQAPGVGPRETPPYLLGVVRSKNVAQIETARIGRDPSQPREEFDEEGLERLAQSLRTRGQLQPISVRWDMGRGEYVIVCGERRWRAAQRAGLRSLSCVVVGAALSASDLLSIQLVENALREDLKPVEQAKAYKQLMDRNGWSTRQVAKELSVAQPQVVRALALLNLPEGVREKVEQGELAPATAYEIGKLADPVAQVALAEQVVAEKLTRQEAVETVKARQPRPPVGEGRDLPNEPNRRGRKPAPKAGPPAPVEIRISDSVTVTVTYFKADTTTPVQALRAALSYAEALEKERGTDAA